ncbi:MAG TPA: hypothetical protein VNY29_16700 [Terriglobales bacterium]|nr:hypothetical protein [Terriglobales bacterium]
MPLARIITDSVDDSLELTIQLRARGFQVETVAPGAVPSTPVDLEVLLEECAPEDALSRASQNPTQSDLWVFVAPGALDERVRVIRELPIEPAVVADSKVVRPPRPIQQSVAAVLPFLTPEDDPILAELVERERSGNDRPQPAPPVERSPEKAELVAFPTVAEPGATEKAGDRVSLAESGTELRGTADREPRSAANLRFWRIATVAAGSAIAALLVGANMSRQPMLSTPTTMPPVSSALPGHATAAPPRAQKASATLAPARTQAKVAVPTKPAPQVSKAAQGGAAKPRRPSITAHAESIIAEDTVVFYDRKPVPSTNGRRAQPGLKQPSRN